MKFNIQPLLFYFLLTALLKTVEIAIKINNKNIEIRGSINICDHFFPHCVFSFTGASPLEVISVIISRLSLTFIEVGKGEAANGVVKIPMSCLQTYC